MSNKARLNRMIKKYYDKKNEYYATPKQDEQEMQKILNEEKINRFNQLIANVNEFPLNQIYNFQKEYKINITNYNSSKRINKIQKDGILITSDLIPDDTKLLLIVENNIWCDEELFSSPNRYTFSLALVMGEEDDLFVIKNNDVSPVFIAGLPFIVQELPYIIQNGELKDLSILKAFNIGNDIFKTEVLENDICKAIENEIIKANDFLDKEHNEIVDKYNALKEEIESFGLSDKLENLKNSSEEKKEDVMPYPF